MTGQDVTVVIPVYNSRDTVLAVLDSVYGQSERPAKILVVNDGSTDDSAKLCQDWASAHGEIQTEIITTKNAGVSAARNTGIKMVRTALTAFVDSDDVWNKTKLALQLDIFNSHEDSVLTGTGSNLRPTTGQLLLVTKKDLLRSNRFITSSVVCRTDVLKEFLFDETLRRSEDFNLWLKIVARGHRAFILDTRLVEYRLEGNKLSNALAAFEKDELKNFRLLFSQGFITPGEFLYSYVRSYLKYIRRRIRKSPYGHVPEPAATEAV